jgi:hypothetical protein
MSRKTYGRPSAMPSTLESERSGTPACWAAIAARSASALVTPPRMATAPSAASCATASAAPSGSPRVSFATTRIGPPSGIASATPWRMASPQALNLPERGTATPRTPATVGVFVAARAASATPRVPPFGISRDRASISCGESLVATMSSAFAVSRSRSAGGR